VGFRQSPLENVAVKSEFWKGKRVFVTGHTGFKGGWLSLWLTELGAQVHGYALQPNTTPNFFNECKLRPRLASSTNADIRDTQTLLVALQSAKPEIVFHLAAQPLVRYSYDQPVETYAVNVMGTVNLLEAVRYTPSVRALVNVTTDKCYENHERPEAYREGEAMGGHDPYSSSKGCSELVTSAYRRSFLAPKGIHVATARAGNVIGGGDWAMDRLIPDILRALDAKESISIRSPHATRPWQHVLEPLSGYLSLAEHLFSEGSAFAQAWNFGPRLDDSKSVQWIVEHLCAAIPGATWRAETTQQPHEANTLTLDSTKAREQLGWQPRWTLTDALRHTLEWHAAWKNGKDLQSMSVQQICDYSKAMQMMASAR
jgi:CDP-glucose 4,6-dehydratase